MPSKRITAPFYTETKTGIHNMFRSTRSPEGYLYSKGRYITKITAEDLPEHYIYGWIYKALGYISVLGVKDVLYRPNYHINHLHKDDLLYVSYDKPIVETKDEYGHDIRDGCDALLYGHMIIDFIRAVRKYQSYDIEPIATTTIRMKSQADKLIYRYDYGDNWEITVTCDNAYYMADNPFYWMSDNKLTHLTGELDLEDAFENVVELKERKIVQKACYNQKPICVAADGLNLFDDAGGIRGFAKFLETVNTTTRKDVLEEILETPRMYGWTAKEGRLESKL